MAQNWEDIAALRQFNVNIHYKDKQGMNALCYLAITPWSQRAETLANDILSDRCTFKTADDQKIKTNINDKYYFGLSGGSSTILSQASRFSNYSFIQLLIHHGAKVSRQDFLEIRDKAVARLAELKIILRVAFSMPIDAQAKWIDDVIAENKHKHSELQEMPENFLSRLVPLVKAEESSYVVSSIVRSGGSPLHVASSINTISASDDKSCSNSPKPPCVIL